MHPCMPFRWNCRCFTWITSLCVVYPPVSAYKGGGYQFQVGRSLINSTPDDFLLVLVVLVAVLVGADESSDLDIAVKPPVGDGLAQTVRRDCFSPLCQLPHFSGFVSMIARLFKRYQTPLLMHVHPDRIAGNLHRTHNEKSVQVLNAIVDKIRVESDASLTAWIRRDKNAIAEQRLSFHVKSTPETYSLVSFVFFQQYQPVLRQSVDSGTSASVWRHVALESYLGLCYQVFAVAPSSPSETIDTPKSLLKSIISDRNRIIRELTELTSRSRKDDVQTIQETINSLRSLRQQNDTLKSQRTRIQHAFTTGLRHPPHMRTNSSNSADFQEYKSTLESMYDSLSGIQLHFSHTLTPLQKSHALQNLYMNRTGLHLDNWARRVPILVGDRYARDLKGVVQVPFDFQVSDLQVFLDEHFDSIFAETESATDGFDDD